MLGPAQDEAAFRQLEPRWNVGLIAASIAVSLLGAFTSTQMMCQARTSRFFSGVLVWTILGSLTFGFCSIWSLHFIAILACEFDVLIGLNVVLTILSAILAVAFTFMALGFDLLWTRYLMVVKKKRLQVKREARRDSGRHHSDSGGPESLPRSRTSEETERLIPPDTSNGSVRGRVDHTLGPLEDHFANEASNEAESRSLISSSRSRERRGLLTRIESLIEDESLVDTDESVPRSSNEDESSPWSSGTASSETSSLGIPGFMSFKVPKSNRSPATNALVGIADALYHGATLTSFAKGFIWSLAITSMHWVGIMALQIPDGHISVQPVIVLLSALISWLVCTIGCILIPHIEVNLSQQLLFSVVAAAGVAAMHFTGSFGTSFYSRSPPTPGRGYPPNLAVAVTSIAILTCIFANGLLAHSATIARNKLAEIVQTRKKLWAAIAQKENAEAAAAARSEFIASASHEIRTPLHQLQGYSDLLSRMELDDESRLLLLAIQQATRSLSMITANVLDWSRLEKGEAVCRPISLDLRKVCESLITILPNKDDEMSAELFIVVSPDVPTSLFLDETYLQRILMNLLTNALKFTQSGYVILLVDAQDETLAITVKDSGYGIPQSFLPDLFEPFKQAQTRGAERGTGLGLAIIKQLLHKMKGTISVESECQQTEEVGPDTCGSTFKVSIPITVSHEATPELGALGPNRQIGLFLKCSDRLREGLQLAWKTFGFDLIPADPDGDISDSWGYIWTDLGFLRTRPKVLHRLLQVQKQLVLVSYDSQPLWDKLLGHIPPPHIVPVRRPFLWHRVVENMMSADHLGQGPVDRSVRFAPVVDIVEDADASPIRETKALSGSTVLLVEDNKINQKLGVKMLKMLGYNVIVAEDGKDAIDKLVENESDIDIILMDQSMPRMDGITATKRIREMELFGPLSRGRLPIIMVTAAVGPDAQAQCMEAGTDAFLPKPLALSKLDKTLKQFLS